MTRVRAHKTPTMQRRINSRRSGLTLIELLFVMLVLFVLISLLLPAVQLARDCARRYSCRDHLMQIGLALRNYESAWDCLPPGTVDFGRPIKNVARGYHVGWIVRILPQLEQAARLQQFDFSASVYDKENSTVLSVRLPFLVCNSSPTGASDYAGCHHDVEAPIDIDNSGVLLLNKCIAQDDISDGISHTIFVGETNDAVLFGWPSGTRDTLRNTGTPISVTSVWPAGGAALPSQPSVVYVGGFGSYHSGGANFLFGDGSVRFLSGGISMRVYQRLDSSSSRWWHTGGRFLRLCSNGQPGCPP